MSKEDPKYTLWTLPPEAWSDLLESFEVTKEVLEQIARELGAEDLDTRVRKYKVPVRQETLAQALD